MGTRGILGFRIGGKDKLTYNHNDSYPGGLGSDVVKAVLKMKRMGWAAVKGKAKAIRLVTDKKPPTPADVQKCKFVSDLSVSSGATKEWYCLLRGIQGNLLGYLQLGLMEDSHKFIADSLSCEWGYIINLDSMMLEVYKGFQSSPHNKGRYAHLEKVDNDYYPCALLLEIDLDAVDSEFDRMLVKISNDRDD